MYICPLARSCCASCLHDRSLEDDLRDNPTTENLKTVDGGYRLFSAVVLSTCCIVSVFDLFALSVDDLLRTGRCPGLSNIFKPSSVKAFLVLSWIFSFLTALLLIHDLPGSTALWSSFNKLPIGVSRTGLATSLPVVAVGLAIVSLATMVNFFVVLTDHVAKMMWGPNGPEDTKSARRLTLVIILLRLFLNLVFSLLFGIIVILDLTSSRIHFAGAEIVSYFGWWLYLAGSSWNPWLYHLHRRHFREAVVNVPRKLSKLRLRISRILRLGTADEGYRVVWYREEI